MALAGLLTRLLPGIYADPNRDRRCRACGQEVSRGDLVSGRYCSEPCANEDWTQRNS